MNAADSGATLHVPDDAVIFTRQKTRTIVIVSAFYRKVLKIGDPALADALIREGRALDALRTCGLEEIAPSKLDEGVTSNGSRWLLTSLASNEQPLDAPFYNFRKQSDTWRGLLYDRILPKLRAFYDFHGPEIITHDELLESLFRRASNHPLADQILSVIDAIRRIPVPSECYQIRVRVHGDMKPGHLHNSHDGWKLIDWGGSRDRSLTKDVFGPLMVPKGLPKDRAFWAFLKGNTLEKELPASIRLDLTAYSRWCGDWRGFDVSPNTIRFQALTDVVETACLRWENRGKAGATKELGALSDL